MQYILTEEEYKKLVPKSKYEEEVNKVEKLNKRVLELSNFLCIKEVPRFLVYCDNCPVVNTCNKNKEFSK